MSNKQNVILAQTISDDIYSAIAKIDCKNSKLLESFQNYCFDNYTIADIEGAHRLYYNVRDKHTNELLASFAHKDSAFCFVEMRSAQALSIDYI